MYKLKITYILKSKIIFENIYIRAIFKIILIAYLTLIIILNLSTNTKAYFLNDYVHNETLSVASKKELDSTNEKEPDTKKKESESTNEEDINDDKDKNNEPENE